MLGLLENAFVIQKIESIHIYSSPLAKLSHRFLLSPPWQKEITHFPQAAVFQNLFPTSRKRVAIIVEKMTKYKLVKVLVSSFSKSHHLCSPHIFGFVIAAP